MVMCSIVIRFLHMSHEDLDSSDTSEYLMWVIYFGSIYNYLLFPGWIWIMDVSIWMLPFWLSSSCWMRWSLIGFSKKSCFYYPFLSFFFEVFGWNFTWILYVISSRGRNHFIRHCVYLFTPRDFYMWQELRFSFYFNIN